MNVGSVEKRLFPGGERITLPACGPVLARYVIRAATLSPGGKRFRAPVYRSSTVNRSGPCSIRQSSCVNELEFTIGTRPRPITSPKSKLTTN
jgi:hypothetical protein